MACSSLFARRAAIGVDRLCRDGMEAAAVGLGAHVSPVVLNPGEKQRSPFASKNKQQTAKAYPSDATREGTPNSVGHRQKQPNEAKTSEAPLWQRRQSREKEAKKKRAGGNDQDRLQRQAGSSPSHSDNSRKG